MTNKELIEDPYNKPVCSIPAARKIVNFIRPQDHNAMLANWDDKQINLEMLSINVALMDFITLNYEELEIDLNNFQYIVDTVDCAQHPSYQRGYNDGERRVIKESVKVSQVDTGDKPAQPQKVFGIPVTAK